MKKLGIVAGSGALPSCLVQACEKQGRPYFVLALKGHAEVESFPKGTPIKWIRLGAIGQGFDILKKEGVHEIVMIGAVRRPSLLEMRPDWRGMKFFARAGVKALGDDGLLKAVINEIESEGFKVVGADSLMPSLVATRGIYGKIGPAPEDAGDIEKGRKIAQLLGKADVGQAVVIQQGIVLAVEAIEGTAELIKRAGALKRAGMGGVLVKMSKPQQERRVDLPTIGVQTIRDVAEAGLAGIAIEAGSVLLVEAEKMVALADKLDIFIVGVE